MDNFKLALDEIIKAHLEDCGGEIKKSLEMSQELTIISTKLFVHLLKAAPFACREEAKEAYLKAMRRTIESAFKEKSP